MKSHIVHNNQNLCFYYPPEKYNSKFIVQIQINYIINSQFMSVINEAQCPQGDGGLYSGFKPGNYHKQPSREHQNLRYNNQLMSEQEQQLMKMSLDGKLLNKQRAERQSSERRAQQSSATRRQAGLSREQVIRMKAERNCLRNMSSSSEEDDFYPRRNSNQGRHAGSQRKGYSAAQVGEKTEIIRNTNHHKSQSISDVVPHMQVGAPVMGEAPDSIFDGNNRMSYDVSDQQLAGGRHPVSMSFTQGRPNGGQQTMHERRMSHNFVDPSMRMSNTSFHQAPSKASKQSKMSKMRSSVSQSSLLAKQVDKNGKLDEIIKRSQELRERRKHSQSRANSRDRQQNSTRLSLVSNGGKKGMMQTLNVPEPQILINTRPSLVSASGDFTQNPNLTDRTGAMSFAQPQSEAFEQATDYKNGLPFQIPVRDEPGYQGGSQQSTQKHTQRRSSLADVQPERASQENDVKSKLLSQLSQNLQRQRQRQQVHAASTPKQADLSGDRQLSGHGHSGQRQATLFEKSLAQYQQQSRMSELNGNLQLEYTQPDQMMNTINFEHQAEGSRNHASSFVSSNKSSSGAPAQKKPCKPLKPPKSVKNGKLPRDMRQKSRGQFFGNEPGTTKGHQKILFTEQQSSASRTQHNPQEYVKYMEGVDLLDSDILDVHVASLDRQQYNNRGDSNEKGEHIAKIDNINRKISRCQRDGNSKSRSRERPHAGEGSGLSQSLSQRAVKLSNYQHLMQKQKRMTSEHSPSYPVPRVMSVQDQYKQVSQDRRRAEPELRPNRPRTNTEFQQFLLMQDGIKQIQNAIKNKLSNYFTEIKEYSNFQGQTQQTSGGHQSGRTVQEAFDAYRSSLKNIQDHQKSQQQINSSRGAETAQLSLAQRYDLLKKQSSSVKMQAKNRQLKKQYEESIKELGHPPDQRKTPNSAADGSIEKSIDTVRKTFEEKLKSLKEDFHRNLNEIATAKTTASNSGCDASGQAVQENGSKVPVHQIYISGQKHLADEDERSPPTSCKAKTSSQPPFPNSARHGSGKVQGANQGIKKQRSFLKEDGRGCATELDQLGSGRRGGASQQDRKVCTKFRGEDDEDGERVSLRNGSNSGTATPSKILRILQNDTLFRSVCEALQQKYRMRLEKGFRTWAKLNKLARLQQGAGGGGPSIRTAARTGDQQQTLKSLFEDYFEREQAAKRQAMFKWKCLSKNAKQQENSSEGREEMQYRSNLKKMKLRLAGNFIQNRKYHQLRQIFHELAMNVQKSKMLKTRLKYIVKTIANKPGDGGMGTEQRGLGLEQCFEIWRKEAVRPLASTESRTNLIKRQQNQQNIQINYRYSYNKTSMGSANNSRKGSRCTSTAGQPFGEARDGAAGTNQQQPFKYAPSSLQLGPNGQYRSASSLHSESNHDRSFKAPGATAAQSQKLSTNAQGRNNRYATRGQRARYDQESYQDDEDEDEVGAYGYNPARTGDVSREELGLVAQTASHPEVVPSRSLEVNPQNEDGLKQPNFNKNQTQAIKIENYLDKSGIPPRKGGKSNQKSQQLEQLQVQHQRRSSSISSEGNSQINKACILTTPDVRDEDTTNDANDSRLNRSSSEKFSDNRSSKDQDQLSKMRAQLKALQREYQRENDKKTSK